jgi:transposase
VVDERPRSLEPRDECAAASGVLPAGRSDAFLGERYRRIARRRGKKKAIVAVSRSILVIVWHLLANPDTRFADLGGDFYARQVNTESKKHNHIRELEALGYRVTLDPAA